VSGFCPKHRSHFCPCLEPWLYSEDEKAAYESGKPTAAYGRFVDETSTHERTQLALIFSEEEGQ
jgi:hypothetical protein